MATVGSAIRSLRKHFGETTTQFGKRLRVDNATISRYERGKLAPGTRVTIDLLAMARKLACPVEERILIRELERHFDLGLIGGASSLSRKETIESLVLKAGEMSKGDALMELLGDKKHDPGFRHFVVAVADVMESCGTVDRSVAESLHLWAYHWANPRVAQYFRDSLGFLRASLFGRHGNGGLEGAPGNAEGFPPEQK